MVWIVPKGGLKHHRFVAFNGVRFRFFRAQLLVYCPATVKPVPHSPSALLHGCYILFAGVLFSILC